MRKIWFWAGWPAKLLPFCVGKINHALRRIKDCGDYVVVVNAEKVALTGRKLEQKKYYHHTGYIGGIKGVSVAKQLEEHPERVLQKAVERMLTRGPLGAKQMTKLRIFVGPEHTHQAQNPIVLDIAAKNKKNKRSA